MGQVEEDRSVVVAVEVDQKCLVAGGSSVAQKAASVEAAGGASSEPYSEGVVGAASMPAESLSVGG